MLLGGDVRAFLSCGTAHQQDQENQNDRECGAEPEDVEVRQRRGLLIARVGKDFERELARQVGVAGLLKDEALAVVEHLGDGGIERVELLVEPQRVELVAALLDGLGDGCPDAAGDAPIALRI